MAADAGRSSRLFTVAFGPARLHSALELNGAIPMRNSVVTFLVVALICSGCGTMASHPGPYEVNMGVDHGIYRGVRTDWDWTFHPAPETALGAPIYFMDFPFSFVFDTLLLPFDATGVSAGTRQPEPK